MVPSWITFRSGDIRNTSTESSSKRKDEGREELDVDLSSEFAFAKFFDGGKFGQDDVQGEEWHG